MEVIRGQYIVSKKLGPFQWRVSPQHRVQLERIARVIAVLGGYKFLHFCVTTGTTIV